MWRRCGGANGIASDSWYRTGFFFVFVVFVSKFLSCLFLFFPISAKKFCSLLRSVRGADAAEVVGGKM